MIYYTAQTRGFSIFSIVGDEFVTSTEEPDEVQFAEENAEEPVTEEEEQTPGFTAIMALIFVSIAFLATRKN
jgi:hypothetical protein